MKSVGNQLNRVHEALLRAVEEDDGEEHDDDEGDGAISEVHGIEGAGTNEGVFEDLENWGERVEIDEYAVCFWGEAEGIDDRGRVHQELDSEADEHVEVTVFGREGGDDESP